MSHETSWDHHQIILFETLFSFNEMMKRDIYTMKILVTYGKIQSLIKVNYWASKPYRDRFTYITYANI
jgi:hypothetical protein